MKKGNINVSVENIFPLIKKFLYSDHEIFLRELISNATDATIKLKHIAASGKEKIELNDPKIEVKIDRESGDIGIFRKLVITENPDNLNTEISLTDAYNLGEENKSKQLGDVVLQTLPSFDFGRIAAQTAKQVISFNVREAERERQFNDFVDKKDTILSGIVKRLEFGNVIIDLGRTCLLYTSPSPRDRTRSRMPSSA